MHSRYDHYGVGMQRHDVDSVSQYDNPGVQTEVRGIIRYGVDDTAMPDVALLDNPPSLPDDVPGALDTDDLVPVGGGPAPDSTL